MYTVIIAEQKHIDNIREYRLFLEPFMQESRFTVCQWEPEERESLRDSVPDLEQAVSRREEWRAVILCDEHGLSKKNPFNVVDYKPRLWDEKSGGDMEDFYRNRLGGKKEAYRLAAEQPLARLVTRLCEDPVIREPGSGEGDVVSEEMWAELAKEDLLNQEKTAEEIVAPGPGVKKGQHCDGKKLSPGKLQEYLEFFEYRQCALYKRELREEIRGEEPVQFSLPNEIICIAQRHHEDADYELQCFWSDHDEVEYSKFYDWNLYFDNMRYLVFDVDDKQKQNYRNDYLRFLLSVLLLAGNDIPQGALRPYSVYRLDCETDEDKMAQLFGHYNEKLETTEAELQEQINDIHSQVAERLSDEQAEKIFCAGIHIPIDFNSTYDEDELFFQGRFGLSYDCPTDNEGTFWESSYLKNKKAVKKLVKQPERAVKRATDDVRRMNVLADEKSVALNEYQLRDVQEHIEQEEREMIDTHTNNLYKVQRYLNQMEEQNEGVKNVLGQRMRRNRTLIWGFICLALVVVGSIPLLAMNKMERMDSFPLPSALVLFFGALIVVAVAVLIALFVLRHRLMKQVKAYNNGIRSIVEELENDVNQYSVYLSHACNVMRGETVLFYHEKYGEKDTHRVRILQKHISDMEEQQAILRDVVGEFLSRDKEMLPSFDETPYDYDFSRATDFEYPLPAAPELWTQMEFLERGNHVQIPYGIVKRLGIRREELYDGTNE